MCASYRNRVRRRSTRQTRQRWRSTSTRSTSRPSSRCRSTSRSAWRDRRRRASRAEGLRAAGGLGEVWVRWHEKVRTPEAPSHWACRGVVSGWLGAEVQLEGRYYKWTPRPRVSDASSLVVWRWYCATEPGASPSRREVPRGDYHVLRCVASWAAGPQIARLLSSYRWPAPPLLSVARSARCPHAAWAWGHRRRPFAPRPTPPRTPAASCHLACRVRVALSGVGFSRCHMAPLHGGAWPWRAARPYVCAPCGRPVLTVQRASVQCSDFPATRVRLLPCALSVDD